METKMESYLCWHSNPSPIEIYFFCVTLVLIPSFYFSLTGEMTLTSFCAPCLRAPKFLQRLTLASTRTPPVFPTHPPTPALWSSTPTGAPCCRQVWTTGRLRWCPPDHSLRAVSPTQVSATLQRRRHPWARMRCADLAWSITSAATPRQRVKTRASPIRCSRSIRWRLTAWIWSRLNLMLAMLPDNRFLSRPLLYNRKGIYCSNLLLDR